MPHQKGHVITGQGGRRFKRKAAFTDKTKVTYHQDTGHTKLVKGSDGKVRRVKVSDKTKDKTLKGSDTRTKEPTSRFKKPSPKTLLQAGALITGAMDRGSSKGIAGSIIEADQSSSDFFGEQNTNDASGKKDYSRLDE